MDESASLNLLRECVLAVAPLDLKGMGLLRKQPHLLTGTPSIPRDQLIEAVTEIVAYTARCAEAVRQLATLTPIPLTTVDIEGYGL